MLNFFNNTTTNLKDIIVIGDSQSDYSGIASFGVPPYRSHPSILMDSLNKNGKKFKVASFGISGYTTAQMLGNSKRFMQKNTPILGIIYGGVNDVYTNITGTATAGTANSITLQSTASAIFNSYVGQQITITSGTGSGQTKTITSYSSSRVATVDSAWSTNPNSTSVYSIAAPTLAQLTASQQALVKVLKYGVKGKVDDVAVSVWNQSSLPTNSRIGDRYLVHSDNSTTGGNSNISGDMNPTITGDYSAAPIQSVWEYRNSRAGVSGWGRVAIAGTPAFSDGVENVIIVSANYLNYSTGGDNFPSVFTDYANLRVAQANAAANESVFFCNLYDYMRKLITGGVFEGTTLVPEVTQGSFDWHYANGNQHHNSYGNQLVARAILLTISNNEIVL
jgi:hypothetical protein